MMQKNIHINFENISANDDILWDSSTRKIVLKYSTNKNTKSKEFAFINFYLSLLKITERGTILLFYYMYIIEYEFETIQLLSFQNNWTNCSTIY